jgi:hypothetical protein
LCWWEIRVQKSSVAEAAVAIGEAAILASVNTSRRIDQRIIALRGALTPHQRSKPVRELDEVLRPTSPIRPQAVAESEADELAVRACRDQGVVRRGQSPGGSIPACRRLHTAVFTGHFAVRVGMAVAHSSSSSAGNSSAVW